MGRIHALLGVQSLVAVLVALNRLGTWTLGYVQANEFLRWVFVCYTAACRLGLLATLVAQSS